MERKIVKVRFYQPGLNTSISYDFTSRRETVEATKWDSRDAYKEFIGVFLKNTRQPKSQKSIIAGRQGAVIVPPGAALVTVRCYKDVAELLTQTYTIGNRTDFCNLLIVGRFRRSPVKIQINLRLMSLVCEYDQRMFNERNNIKIS